jgi:hypothetical protein
MVWTVEGESVRAIVDHDGEARLEYLGSDGQWEAEARGDGAIRMVEAMALLFSRHAQPQKKAGA